MAAEHVLRLRVYWEDTDASGIVYYANYLKFMERGRTDLLRDAGLSQQRLLDELGVAFVVRGCRIEYLRPARLDDELAVHTRLLARGGASLELAQEVRRDGVELAHARVRLGCLGKSGRPTRIPEQAVKAIALVSPSLSATSATSSED